MADIRFVKPPNDNRVRQFPKSALHNDVLHITTPTPQDLLRMNAPGTEQFLHITTPKRKTSHVPPWDIFITSKPDCDDQVKSPPSLPGKETANNDNNNNAEKISHTTALAETRQSLKKRLSLSPVGSQKDNTKKCRDLKEGLVASSDEVQDCPAFKKFDNNGNLRESIHEFRKGNSDHQERMMDKRALGYGGISAEKQINAVSTSSKESTDSTENDKSSKCPVLKFYQAFGDSLENTLCDVMDEEIDQLPEVSSPAGSHSPTSLRKTSFSQQQNPQFHQISKQQQELSSKQHHPQHVGVNQPIDQSTKPKSSQPTFRPCQPQYKFLEDTKPIRRSVSDAALAENEGVPSFFKTLKYADYNFDEDDNLDVDDMAFELEYGKNNHLRKLNNKTKNAWECNKTFDTSSSSGSEHSRGKGLERTSRHSSTPIELINGSSKVKLPRSLSRDFTSLDRLRSRRYALADPERMIMSQELREKLEKDVEKRKGSMVRKVSQFFNIQLGLNREEDLI